MVRDTGTASGSRAGEETHPADSEADALIAEYIDQRLEWSHAHERARARDASDASIRTVGIPVWAIINLVRTNNFDATAAAEEYGIPTDAVRAAVAYYGRHRVAIDGRLPEALV